MDLWIIYFYLGATAVTMVESGCFNLDPLGLIGDIQSRCDGWWEKAFEYDEDDGSRGQCVFLIEEKCPSMLTIKTKLSREYDPDDDRYETWVTEGVATDQKGKGMKFFMRVAKTVCSYEQGIVVDCEYLWNIAAGKNTENNIKSICIDSILKNCPGFITLVEEETDSKSHPCVGDFPCRKYTYKDAKSQKTSFNVYETF